MRNKQMDFSALNDECHVFTYYLINQRPNGYVLNKYRDAHRASDAFHNPDTNPFDTFLVSISTTSPFVTKLVDSYTSVFFRRSVVRKKMVLLLAIIESCAPTHSHLDSPDPCAKTTLWIRMVRRGIASVLTLFLSMVLLMPFQLIFAIRSRFLSRA